MQGFIHRYAKSVQVIYRLAQGRGLVSDAMLISANIPLNPADPAFDLRKVDELDIEAALYAKGQGRPHQQIYFAQG